MNLFTTDYSYEYEIVTWNVNGIRAAIRKGIDEYFESMNADIWMLQEVRALTEQLPKLNWPEGYSIHLHAAEKRVIRELQQCQKPLSKY